MTATTLLNLFSLLDREECRVLEIVPYVLEFETEGKKKLLPPKVFTEKYPYIKYPQCIVRNQAYANFGIEYDYAVRKVLSLYYKKKYNGPGFEDTNIRSFFISLDAKSWEQYKTEIVESLEDVLSFFRKHYPRKTVYRVCVEPEITFDEGNQRLNGHPDLVIFLNPKEVVIFDVKVFAKASPKISRPIRAQVASYVAMARACGLTCNTVGIIMPFRRDPTVKIYDVTKWSSTPLEETFIPSITNVVKSRTEVVRWLQLLQKYNVGAHVMKETALHFIKENVKWPFQMFLYSNNPSKETERKGREGMLKLNPDFSKFRAFVHAPYNLNLSKTDSYVAKAMKKYMQDAARFGFKGVVFHTGHHENPKIGIKNMKRNIKRILDKINPSCPLLIETPCGSGTELLSTPQSLSKFILRFPEDKVGLCVDTCHVFVSGYGPEQYLNELPTFARDRILLFHFNGSKKTKGSRCDGHKHVLKGVQRIPSEELIFILDYAKEWNIACVTE